MGEKGERRGEGERKGEGGRGCFVVRDFYLGKCMVFAVHNGCESYLREGGGEEEMGVGEEEEKGEEEKEEEGGREGEGRRGRERRRGKKRGKKPERVPMIGSVKAAINFWMERTRL